MIECIHRLDVDVYISWCCVDVVLEYT